MDSDAPEAGERLAPPEALESLLKLIPSKEHRDAKVCSFCRKATNPPHTYMTCPARPCYLCRQLGHAQTSCPYRDRRGHAAAKLRALLASRARDEAPLALARAAELSGRRGGLPSVRSRQVDARAVAKRKVAEKRVTALEFCSGGDLFVGSKDGEVGVWAEEEGGYGRRRGGWTAGHGPVSAIVWWRGAVYTAGCDGRVVCGGDEECETVFDLNPDGWQGSMARFRMLASLAAIDGGVAAGDDKGNVHRADPRAGARGVSSFRAHGGKVHALMGNPVRPELLLSGALDKRMCVWDMRMLGAGRPLCSYGTGGGVAGAAFSPITGTKVVATVWPNRLLVWDSVHALIEGGAPPPPVKEVIHSHQFSRYLATLRAAWDPKDFREDLFACGRLMGEAYEVEGKHVLLHPLDLLSAESGGVVASLADRRVPTVCTVNRFHPTKDMLVSASSTNVYTWAPDDADGPKPDKAKEEDEPVEEDHAAKKRRVSVVQREGTRRSTRRRT